jgi:glycosyl transferase, family 25
MEHELSRFGIRFEFLKAIDGSKGEHLGYPECNEAESFQFFGCTMSPSEFACLGSHYLAWKHCVESGEITLILEDDLELDDHFARGLEIAKEQVLQFGFIRLFGLTARPFRTIRELTDGFKLVGYLRGPSGAQGYILTAAAARVLVAKSNFWREPVDRFLDRYWEHGFGQVALVPFILSTLEIESDTGTRSRPRSLRRFWVKTLRVWDHLKRIWFNRRNRSGLWSGA